MLARSTSLGLLLTLAVASAVHPAQAKPNETAASSADAAREKSRAAFRRGVTQLRAQDWAGARASFEEAYSLVQHPSILLNLGIARLHTDDPVLAEQDLVRFLSEDPGAAPEEQASARDALAEARAKIGTLRVIATPAAVRVMVDGKPVAVRVDAGATQGVAEARLKAGEHALLVEADGFEPNAKPFDLPAKSETELRISLTAAAASKPPPPARSATRTIIGYSLAGTAGVALVASGLMGARALSLSSDYEDRTSTSFQRPDVKDEGVALRTGADVALVVGLLAGAGAVVLLFTDIGAPRPSPVALRQPALLRW